MGCRCAVLRRAAPRCAVLRRACVFRSIAACLDAACIPSSPRAGAASAGGQRLAGAGTVVWDGRTTEWASLLHSHRGGCSSVLCRNRVHPCRGAVSGWGMASGVELHGLSWSTANIARVDLHRSKVYSLWGYVLKPRVLSPSFQMTRLTPRVMVCITEA